MQSRSAEIGVARREAVLKFVAVGGHNTLGGSLAARVFKTPLYERKELFGYLTVARCKSIASGTIAYHGAVAAVARNSEGVVALGNDRARDCHIVVVHKASEVPEGILRRFIALVVAKEGEKRVDVFRLIVCPDSGIVGLAAGRVHKSAFGAEDALCSSCFSE